MTDTQLATQQGRPPIMVLRERFENRRNELKLSLPSDISPDVFIRATMTSAQLNPEILACTWQSIWNACLMACRDGLLPDGVEGALVPYKGKATWIAMYQGQLRRFRRSGQFRWVGANVVRQDEEFQHWIDELGEHIRHVPGDSIAAPIVRVYAMATTKDGGLFVSVLPIAEANKMRAMSRASRDDAPWKIWPEEMYKKTALRRLAKYLPSARDIIGDEDYEPEATPPTTMADLANRRGAAAALEQFAGSSPQASTAESVDPRAGADLKEGGGEQGNTPADAMASSAAADAASPAATDPVVEVAHKRGQEARAAGHKRSAIPGEYRDPARSKEVDAWLNGYDGKPPTSPEALL